MPPPPTSEPAPADPASADAKPPTARPRRRRWRRWLVRLLVLIVVLLIAGELVARFVMGLGDPPLIMADPHIEYLFRPNQDCRRQGNRILYNAYSMRSEDFPATKSNPAELRVMVIGDSIVNGGNLTDHANLATTLAGPMLQARLDRPVVIGNISAGSWGPPNQLAYVKKFGLFDADVVVLVLSSHDAADVPDFGPLPGPTERPASALAEGLSRYSVGDLLAWLKGTRPPRQAPPTSAPAALPRETTAQSLAALQELIRLAKAGGSKVVLLQHLDLYEVQHQPAEGHALVQQASLSAGANVSQLGPAFSKQLADGPSPFGDFIHPNDLGQKLLAEAIVEAVAQVTADR